MQNLSREMVMEDQEIGMEISWNSQLIFDANSIVPCGIRGDATIKFSIESHTKSFRETFMNRFCDKS